MSNHRTPRRRPRLGIVAAIAVALIAGGAVAAVALTDDDPQTAPAVGNPTTAPGEPVDEPTASSPTLPACAEVFRPGEIVNDALAGDGCTDPDGTTQIVGSFRCADGTHLYQVDASTGATAGWGVSGQPYHASTDAAGDPAYAAAYERCNG